MTRKEQKQKTRQRILDAALDLFIECGYYGTKTSLISKRARVSEGLLFYHFETKEQLLEVLIRMGIEGMRFPSTICAETGLGCFVTFTHMLFEGARHRPFIAKIVVFMNIVSFSADIPDRLRQLAQSVNPVADSEVWVKRGQQDGSIRSGDPQILSNMYWSGILGIMERYAMRPDIDLPEPEWVTQMLQPAESPSAEETESCEKSTIATETGAAAQMRTELRKDPKLADSTRSGVRR